MLAERGEEWLARIAWAKLDLSGPYRSVFDTMVPDATRIVDPFHLVKVRHEEPCTGSGCETCPSGLSQQAGEAEGSLTLKAQGRAESSPDNADGAAPPGAPGSGKRKGEA